MEGGWVNHSWCMCVVVMAIVGWMGQGWSWCLRSMRDKARGGSRMSKDARGNFECEVIN